MDFARLFLVSILFPFLTQAKTNEFCSDTKGLDQISTYLFCQNQAGLAACAGLGTVVAGRFMQKGIQKALDTLLEKKPLPLGYSNKLGGIYEDLPDAMRKWYTAMKNSGETEFRFRSLPPHDDLFNTIKFSQYKDYDSIPKYIQEQLEKRFGEKIQRAAFMSTKYLYLGTEKAIDMQRQSLAQNTSIYLESFFDDSDKRFFHSKPELEGEAAELKAKQLAGETLSENDRFFLQMEESDSRIIDKSKREWMILGRDGEMLKKEKLAGKTLTDKETDFLNYYEKRMNLSKNFMDLFEKEVRGTSPSVAKLATTARNAIARAGIKAPLVAGGVVSLAYIVGSEAMNSDPTACQELNDQYVNRDKEHNCAYDYSVNSNVLKMLDLPAEEQQKLMKNPKVCNFYSKLHEKLLKQPQLVGLECHQSSFSVTTKSDDGVETKYQAQYFQNQKDIRQVNIFGKSGISTKGPIQMEADGTIQNLDSKYVAEVALPMRLFIPDAQACCQNGDDQEHTKCLSAFNSKASTSEQDKIVPHTK